MSASSIAICASRRAMAARRFMTSASSDSQRCSLVVELRVDLRSSTRDWCAISILERGDAIARARTAASSSSGWSARCTPRRSRAVCSASSARPTARAAARLSALARATATPRSASAMRARSLSSSMRRSAVASALRSSSISGGDGGITNGTRCPRTCAAPAARRGGAGVGAAWRAAIVGLRPVARPAWRCAELVALAERRQRRHLVRAAEIEVVAGLERAARDRRRLGVASIARGSRRSTRRCGSTQVSVCDDGLVRASTRRRRCRAPAVRPWLRCRRPTRTRWY